MEDTIEVVKVPVGSPTYNQAVEFLYAEAELLDDNRLADWLCLLADDVVYRMPVRSTVARNDGLGFSPATTCYDDDLASLQFRVRRADSPNGWAEQPPSRTHRIITNIRVSGTNDHLFVSSSVLLLRSRWDLRQPDLLSAKRKDVLVRTVAGFKIARREILVDQTNMYTPNLAVFF